VAVEPGSFGEWLRHLPLAAVDTPVRTHKGEVVFEPGHRYVASVIAIDVGKNDLQAGPDVAIRLHSEWLWSKHALDSITFRGPNRTEMPLSKFLRGERIVARNGGNVESVLLAKPADENAHSSLRDYLDSVFNWVNSRGLYAQAKPVEASDLQPGDFFVHDGKPGDAVVVLDIARNGARGRTLVMLGQALSPAQNLIVVSPGGKIGWFEVNPPTPLVTPHTDEFAWADLRRL
jgi:hypothetical protein